MRPLYIINILVLCLSFCVMMRNEAVVKVDEQTILNTEVEEEIESQYTDDENEGALGVDILRNMAGSIVIEIVGAFLGFLSAIAFANRSAKKQMKQLDLSLHNELLNIYIELEDRFKDKNVVDYYYYQTPIWDINLASGTLALVTNSKIYNKYIQIYSKIQYAQKLEAEYVHTKLFANDQKRFVGNYIKAIDDARKIEANNILEDIKKDIFKEVSTCRE